MKKLIPAIAAAALGIVSLSATSARADEHHDRRDRAPAPIAAPVRAMPGFASPQPAPGRGGSPQVGPAQGGVGSLPRNVPAQHLESRTGPP